MWTRAELKETGRNAFKANYWRTVLVSVIAMVIAGAGGSSIGAGGSSGAGAGAVQEAGEAAGQYGQQATPETFLIGLLVSAIAFAALIIGLMVRAFILNPLDLGCKRFFLINLTQPAEVSSIGGGFGDSYLERVKTLFCRDLFTLLWTMLLVIPGIVKYYEYLMIPYLLADDPSITRQEAFAESRRLMQGNKWNAFILDLSFIGWYILSAVTMGIVGVLYANPYHDMTRAALYRKLIMENA